MERVFQDDWHYGKDWLCAIESIKRRICWPPWLLLALISHIHGQKLAIAAVTIIFIGFY